MSITELRKEMRFYRIAFWINAAVSITTFWVAVPDLVQMGKEYRQNRFHEQVKNVEVSCSMNVEELKQNIMPSCFKGRK